MRTANYQNRIGFFFCRPLLIATLFGFLNHAAWSQSLTSHVPGVRPVPPTHTVIFKGSDAWVRVGINANLGGVATTLDLINPAHPEAPLVLIDNRSAAGAAWQTSMGLTNGTTQNTNYNQFCGNSDGNWGYQSSYSVSSSAGIIQQQWLPLESNDYRQPAYSSNDIPTSPCPTHISNNILPSILLGSGTVNITPQLIPVTSGTVLRLTDAFTYLPSGNQNWTRVSVDQCLYLLPDAVKNGNLRLYIAQTGYPVIGPIKPYGAAPMALKPSVRNIVSTNNPVDWCIFTNPLSYAVLVFQVGGRDIGIAIHQTNQKTFQGIFHYRSQLFTGVMAEQGDSSEQWHFNLDSSVDSTLQTSFSDGVSVLYSVDYDIAPVEQLAAEGFPIAP